MKALETACDRRAAEIYFQAFLKPPQPSLTLFNHPQPIGARGRRGDGLAKIQKRDSFGGMQTQRRHTGANCATTRSTVSNGSRLLQNVDGRSSSARRFRDLVRAYEVEVGGTLSELERGLVRQAAILSLKTEQMQECIVRGEEVDSDTLIRLSGEARRILTSLRKRHNGRDPSSATAIEDLVA